MSSGLISIALSGLRAAQTGLATTGHNIANVNTPGFSRQTVIQTGALATFSGTGYVGTGVNVTSVRRVYSEFAAQALRDTTATSQSASSFSTEIGRLDGFLADSSSNLSSAIDSFFATTQTLANDPASAAARQTLLSSARTLAARFNDLSSRLASQGADVDRQIDDNVASVNALAQQVAALNARITNDGRDPANNDIPNDLLDQRDQIVQQIASAIGATAIPQSDGTLNLFVGNGQPLVVGSTANQLVSVPDDQDSSKKQLAVILSGNTVRVSTQGVTGGTVGGLFQYRDTVLGQATNALGQIAIGLASALNDQNKLGQDANGNLGAALFGVGSPTVLGSTGNSSGAALSVTIADAKALTTADYKLAYDGTNYTLQNLSDHTTRTFSSLPQTVDGVTIGVSSPLAAGDRFTISPTRTGASAFSVLTTDPARIATAAPVKLTTGANNRGSAVQASLSVVPATTLPANLQAPVNVVFHVTGSTTTYDLVDRTTGTAISSGNAYTDGSPITQNGWKLTFSGTPADGDTFTVGPNPGGTGDNRNALLLAGIQQKAVTIAGSAQDTYSGLVGSVGNQANEASSLATAESSLLTQAQETRDSVSGVNLDEEAANLQKYQQAYQAASKSIATASAMFDAVLDLFN